MSVDFSKVDTTILDEDDAPDVSDEVYSLASKFIQLGRALGIPPSKLKEIQDNNGTNSANALNDILCEWLKKNYKVEKFGEPSWQKLCEAVAKSSGGNNKTLAEKVAANHPAAAKPSGGNTKALAEGIANRHIVNYDYHPEDDEEELPHQQPPSPIPMQADPPPAQLATQPVQQATLPSIQQDTQIAQNDTDPLTQDPTQVIPSHERDIQLIQDERTRQDHSMPLNQNEDVNKYDTTRCQPDGFNDGPEIFRPFSRKRRNAPVQLNSDTPAEITVTPRWGYSKSSKFGYYPMRKFPHGIAVIISNENFTNPKKNREGTEIDERNLTVTFQVMGYIVEVHRDCTSAQILEIMDEIRIRDHSQYDSFVCCILSHGNEGHIYGSDLRTVPIKEIGQKLNGDCCESLAGKPKLFFLQTCRGKMEDRGISIPFRDPLRTERGARVMTDSDNKIPKSVDFFYGYATAMGMRAWRREGEGSLYVSELCTVLCQESVHASLDEMMKEVCRRVSMNQDFKDDEDRDCKEAPEIVSRLSYDVFF